MSTFTRIIRLGAAMAAIITPLAAKAQETGSWVLTPYAGAYLPSGDLSRISASAGGISGAMQVKHQSAIALGGTASYWFADRMAVEFGGAYAFSDARTSIQTADPAFGNMALSGTDGAHVMLASAKLMFALLPTSNSTQLRFGIGPAVVSRGGSAYASDAEGSFQGLTDVGGTASLCTRIPVNDVLALRLRAESYFYQSQLKWRSATDPSSNVTFDRRFQNDFVLSGGLQIMLKR